MSKNGSGFDFNGFEFDDYDFGNLSFGGGKSGKSKSGKSGGSGSFNFGGAEFNPYILNNFSQHFDDVHIKENTKFVVDIETHDDHSTEANGQLTYDIIGGADKDFFEIDARDGRVFFKQAPDFENPLDQGRDNEYEVKVRVTDASGRIDTQTVYVQVKDVFEDAAPRIISNGGGDTANIRVDENNTFVTDVQTFDAISSEANGQLIYSLHGGSDESFFTIDGSTGVLSFRNAPDFETPRDQGGDNTYQVGVKVTDAAGNTDTQLITVDLRDINENTAPEIISNGGGDSATVNVDENKTFVTDVQTNDDFSSEANGQLSYAITSGADQDLFTINESNGRLSFKNAPDFENPVGGDNRYSLHVTVTDAGGLTDTQTINVNVNNVDENTAPVIISNGGGDSATVNVDENKTFVTDVQTRDDFSTEANGQLSYAITSGDDQNLFTINESNGQLSFKNAPDFENPVGGDNKYSLHVTVTDAGGLTDTQTINVNVNNVDENTAPVIISNGGGDSATVNVDENKTFVTDVQTRDDFSTEANGQLSYAITSGDDQNLFTINESNGQLSFKNAPDFENPVGGDNRYSLHVTVTDAGGLTDTQTINVNVGDVDENAAPDIISNGGRDSATVNVRENQTFVTDVETRDDFSTEANGELSYAITSGTDQNLFTINESSGRLSFLNAPDFENPVGGDNKYSLHVTVTDAGGLTDTQTINVNVTDVFEAPPGKVIKGTEGDDHLVGMDGPDKIRGFGGNDKIKGLGGNDDLLGGKGNDNVSGGDGRDRINGTDSLGRGFNEFDVLSGGAGHNTFVLADNGGSFYVGHGYQDLAAILDFKVGSDRLVLYGSASDYSLETSNFGTAIIRGGDAIANLKDVNIGSLDLNQFTYIH